MRFFIIILGALMATATLCAQQADPAAWKQDIEWLRKELPARHPDLYHRVSKKVFDKELDKLLGSVSGKTNAQVAVELQTVLALTGDPAIRLDINSLLQREKVIPIGMGWYADGLYVSGTVKKFEKAMGAKVVEINGIKPEEVLKKAQMFFPVVNDYTARREAMQCLRFPVYFRKAGISPNDTLQLLVEKRNGQREKVNIFPIDITSQRGDMTPARFQQESPDLRWQPIQSLYSLQWLESDSIMYVQYNRCASQELALEAGDSLSAMRLPPFQPLIDSLATFLTNTPGARVLLDLRFNSGGGTSDGERLARRLAQIESVNRPEKLFVAVNLYTAGAALQVATLFDELTKASIIGDPSADKPNQYVGIKSFGLPRSGLTIYHPTRFQRLVKGDPEVLKPEVPVNLSFEDFRKGKDPVMDYVRKQKSK